MAKISEVVTKIIARKTGLNVNEIDLSDKFEDLNMDSIDVDELVETLSEIYGTDFGAFYDHAKHKTVRSICAMVQAYR